LIGLVSVLPPQHCAPRGEEPPNNGGRTPSSRYAGEPELATTPGGDREAWGRGPMGCCDTGLDTSGVGAGAAHVRPRDPQTGYSVLDKYSPGQPDHTGGQGVRRFFCKLATTRRTSACFLAANYSIRRRRDHGEKKFNNQRRSPEPFVHFKGSTTSVVPPVA